MPEPSSKLDARAAEAPRAAQSSARIPGYFHLRALFSPLFTLLYLATAPHAPLFMLAFLSVQVVIQRSESHSPDETRAPSSGGAILDAIPYALFALHFLNLFLCARLLAQTGWLSVQTLPALFFLCLSSALAGASAAHELIHRPRRLPRALGRLLLASFFQDHFFVEHLRGHHVRAGTREDPATARLGETLFAFLPRTLVGQLASAWRLDRRAVRLGFMMEAAIGAITFFIFGGSGLLALAVQAASTIFFIQVANYIEHWGLERAGELLPASSWDTNNRNTLLGILGLARHADHHLHPGRPFHALRYLADSPKLPHGYDAMIGLALFANRRFQRLLLEELTKKGLLPGGTRTPP